MSGGEPAGDRNALRPHPQVVARRVEDEFVLVQLDRNNIYALNRTGARLWELIAEGRSRSEACSRMIEEFDVPEADLEREVDDLLDNLVREGLLLTGEE